MDLTLCPVCLLQYNVGLCEALCDVSPLVRLCRRDAVTYLMHAGRTLVQRLALIGNKGKPIILHLDGADSVPGQIGRRGRDRSDGLTLIPAERIKELHADLFGVRPVDVGLGLRREITA